MVFPLVVWAVAAAVAAAAGVAAVAVAQSERRERVDSARVILIGPRRSGKSTLHRFLTGEQQVRQYVPTQTADKGFINLEDFGEEETWQHLKWQVQVEDLPGSPEHMQQWFEESQSAQVICFCVATPALHTEASVADQARRAAKQVALWNREITDRPSPAVVLVFSHVDLEGDSVDDIRGREEVRQLRIVLSVSEENLFLVNLLKPADSASVGLRILEILSSECSP